MLLASNHEAFRVRIPNLLASQISNSCVSKGCHKDLPSCHGLKETVHVSLGWATWSNQQHKASHTSSLGCLFISRPLPFSLSSSPLSIHVALLLLHHSKGFIVTHDLLWSLLRGSNGGFCHLVPLEGCTKEKGRFLTPWGGLEYLPISSIF